MFSGLNTFGLLVRGSGGLFKMFVLIQLFKNSDVIEVKLSTYLIHHCSLCISNKYINLMHFLSVKLMGNHKI